MFAKVAIFCAAVAAVHASGFAAPLVNTGVSARSQTQDVLGNYAFGYNIKDGLGATNSARSRRWLWKQEGIYTITDIDGRARRVDYVADGHGFRTSVKTNEPGTAASAPAAALIASPYAGPVAPVVNHVAPAAPAYAAPVAYGAPVAAVAAPVAYGGVIGHGAALGLGYGAGIVGAGYGKVFH
ncbi:adult-specific rigid cuticular protein 15.7 [Trichonephila inaurata madagascariensis]|uniref:Adult-specific rigid cuticular protein 15.7 n=1 Tax=Trichonephila inaurata madagascariensis TaxID=2747483 RepID=A0A8X6IFX2_9ARAC|nr:adult-specific rigid cuticular protein 15.7 [Trichonephila inaurata madagascariensis]